MVSLPRCGLVPTYRGAMSLVTRGSPVFDGQSPTLVVGTVGRTRYLNDNVVGTNYLLSLQILFSKLKKYLVIIYKIKH